MTAEERILDYLQLGGLWNPEMMEHDKVRELLMDCREALHKKQEALEACKCMRDQILSTTKFTKLFDEAYGK